MRLFVPLKRVLRHGSCFTRKTPSFHKPGYQRATIVSKAYREPSNIKPFPYEKEPYTIWRMLWDDTGARLDENSRIIVVEGNMGVGKSTLAKVLAEKFDFMHFPEATVDWLLVDDYGFDLRSIQDKFPESLHPFDASKFFANPGSVLVPDYMYNMLAIRSEQYLDAMAHLLNTGQGVVLERSPFSDFIFMNALYRFGYVKKDDLEVYNEMRSNILNEIFKPHLIIYLDAPAETLQDRIKKRGVAHEVSSKLLTADYFKYVDTAYKRDYLYGIKTDSELLVYDWSAFGDPDLIVDDIERLDMEKAYADPYDSRFSEWKLLRPRELDDIRYRTTMLKKEILNLCVCHVWRYNLPELVVDPEDVTAYIEARNKYAPQYDAQFDPKNGWSWLFRWDSNYRDEIRFAYRTR